MNIFVARLNYDTQEGDLRHVFEAYGEVDSAKIIMDRYTGRSRGFGFVEMPNDDEARAAITELNQQELDGRTIVVKKAEPRGNRRSSDNQRGYSNSYGSSYGYGSGSRY